MEKTCLSIGIISLTAFTAMIFLIDYLSPLKSMSSTVTPLDGTPTINTLPAISWKIAPATPSPMLL
jgi:hypothetical protein